MTERTPAGRAVRAGARGVVAAVALGCGVVLVVAAALVPWPSLGSTPLSITATPVPVAQQLACAGSLLALGDSSGQNVDTAHALGAPAVSFGPGKAQQGALKGAGAAAVFDLQDSTTVAASQAQAIASGGLSGLAASACTSASSDSWLVGGATTTGRTTLVSLANPTQVDAVVDLSVFTEKGEVSAPGASGIEVAAGTQTVLSLAGLAPDAVAPVVHVQSSGGLVVASLQVSISRGLIASGVDTVTPTVAPAQRLVIPGLVIVGANDNSNDVQNRIAQDPSGEADLSTVLRLYVPGTTDAKVSIAIAPEGGTAQQGASLDASATAGAVTEIGLDGLDSGDYTVTVTSDRPVTGAVRSSVASTPAPQANSTDLAWFPVPARIAVPTSLAVPAGPSPLLHVANQGADDVTVDLGAAGSLTVPAHGSASKAVAPGVLSIAPSAAVTATLTYASTNQLAAVAVQPRAADGDPVTVWP